MEAKKFENLGHWEAALQKAMLETTAYPETPAVEALHNLLHENAKDIDHLSQELAAEAYEAARSLVRLSESVHVGNLTEAREDQMMRVVQMRANLSAKKASFKELVQAVGRVKLWNAFRDALEGLQGF